jgi:SARP family transcriptional regulator, regulator of embCAB operon
MQFNILGPLEVRDGDIDMTPTPPKVRAVLGLLLLRANQVVAIDTLVEELWGDEPPRSAVTTAQTYIYHLRRAFGQTEVTPGQREWLVTAAPGYMMRVGHDQLDAQAFDRLTWEGRQRLERGEAEEAGQLLRRALQLWRGPALANVTAGSLLTAHAVHLEEERLRALQLRIMADAELGQYHALIGELRSLVAAHPLNEWFHGQLIVALSRCGRRSEALQAYQVLRTVLRDELGLDPQPELQRLHQDVLTYDIQKAPNFALPPASSLASV